MKVEKWLCPDGSTLAYEKIKGQNPGILFLGGFKSDMMGTKASYLADVCQSLGRAFVRFDYFGHGLSSGQFEEGNLGRWKQDALAILDNITEGPQIIIGSSMGGWLMMLVGRERPDRLHGMIGIASAPDFTLDLKKELEKIHENMEVLPKEYEIISKAMLEEGHQHHVLHADINISCPVRLLHGMQDATVSYLKSFALLERLLSQDVHLTLIKDGDHRLNRPEDLRLLDQAINQILNA